MSVSLLVKALAPPEGWLPDKFLDEAITGRQYAPVPADMLAIFMSASWAYEQMCHYGTLLQLGADEGESVENDEIKLLCQLMNRFADARKMLDREFWANVDSVSVVVRYVDGKPELALSVDA